MTDEQLNSTFYKFAKQEGDDEPELMDYESAEKFARAIEELVREEMTSQLTTNDSEKDCPNCLHHLLSASEEPCNSCLSVEDMRFWEPAK